MPEISFDLNLGALFSPLFVVALAYFMNRARKAINAHTDARHDTVENMVTARHAETTAHLERIEAIAVATETLAKVTNGRVTALELQAAKHDGILIGRGEMTS